MNPVINVFNLLSDYKTETIIHYGNSPGHDVDLLIISMVKDAYMLQKINNYDLLIIGYEKANSMINILEPQITEPLLTGKAIAGQRMAYHYQALMKRVKIDNNVCEKLIQRAKIYFNWTHKLIEQGNYTDSFANFTFITSYVEFAQWYKNHKELTTFSQLLENRPTSLMTNLHMLLKSGFEPDIDYCKTEMNKIWQYIKQADKKINSH